MNGRKAKEIRRKIYGTAFSTRQRGYVMLESGAIVATGRRRMYLDAKKRQKLKP